MPRYALDGDSVYVRFDCCGFKLQDSSSPYPILSSLDSIICKTHDRPRTVPCFHENNSCSSNSASIFTLAYGIYTGKIPKQCEIVHYFGLGPKIFHSAIKGQDIVKLMCDITTYSDKPFMWSPLKCFQPSDSLLEEFIGYVPHIGYYRKKDNVEFDYDADGIYLEKRVDSAFNCHILRYVHCCLDSPYYYGKNDVLRKNMHKYIAFENGETVPRCFCWNSPVAPSQQPICQIEPDSTHENEKLQE